MYAVISNDREMVRSLVENGVNINFPWYNPSNPSAKDGSTALLCAVSLNHIEIIEVLLNAGAYINKCDRMGCTPVYKAAFHGRPFLIEQLSRAGADVNLADYGGKTPLYICVNNAIVHTSSCKLAVQKLLSAGAILDKQDHNGQGPVHIAAHWKLVEILRMLINSKSNVNLVDNRGRTPLYLCVSSLSTKLYAEDLRHQMPCIITLFKAGADMLNLIEWLLYKGPGVVEDLMEGSKEFKIWYNLQISRPQTLKSMCRKVIQKVCTKPPHCNDLCKIVKQLPLPPQLTEYVCRKMFYRDPKPPAPPEEPDNLKDSSTEDVYRLVLLPCR